MKYILSLLLLSYTLQLSAQKSTEPYTINRFAEAKITNVRSETSGGNISIVGENTPSPRVEVYIEPNNNRRENRLTKEEIKQRLEADYVLTVAVANNTITAIARPKKTDNRDWDWRNSLSISFRIYVPKNAGTELRTSGGNIHLSDLNGTHDFRTSGGNLVIDNLGGKMEGRTSGGNITLKGSKDEINLSTSGGNIEADNCSGNIHLTTSGGNLELSELKGDIRATTSGGNVHGDHISGDLVTHTSGGSVKLKAISGGLDASTSGGDVDVALSDVTKSVKISNTGGNIYLQLPKNKGMDLRLSADNVKTEGLGNFKGLQEKDRLEGSLNGGGASVRASASSGTIRLVLQ